MELDLGAVFKDFERRLHDRSEALTIVKFMRLYGINKVTDIGCFIGALASNIQKVKKTSEYIAVDAAQVYLDAAQKYANITRTVHATILSDHLEAKYPYKGYFMIDARYPSNCSTQFPTPDKLGMCKVPIADKIHPIDFVKQYPELFADDRYVKIDIDGSDMPLVKAVLDAGHRPAALQFEVWNQGFDSGVRIPELVSQLRDAGYFIPPFDFEADGFFMICVTKNHAWMCNFLIPRDQQRWFIWSRDTGLISSMI